MVVTSCFHDTPVDPGKVGDPDSTPSAEAAEQAALNAFPPGALGLQDIFADMARRVPGGFGGLYYDEEGRLTIVLTDPSRHAEARAALDQEPFIQDRESRAADGSFQLSGAEVRGAAFDYATLDRWHRLIMYQLSIVPVSTSIDVRGNRISIGVVSEAHLDEMDQVLISLGVPDAAVEAKLVTPPQLARRRAQSFDLLTDKHRPVPAGVQIKGPATCTIGPNVRWHASVPEHPDSTQATFLVPSHCTDDPYNHHWSDTAGTPFHQPEPGPIYDPDRNFIGREVWDPEVEHSGCINSTFGCRNSDAALAIYQDQDKSEFGRIARPGARNPTSGYQLIDTQDPRFEIVAREGWSLQGQTLEKVGRTTGWSGGQVWDGCKHFTPPNSPTIWCSVEIEGRSRDGDSGAPIFRVLGEDPETGLDVEIRGMLYAGSGYVNGVLNIYYCDGGTTPPECFIGSNLEGIEMDLDPNWQTGLFQYWPGGPIW